MNSSSRMLGVVAVDTLEPSLQKEDTLLLQLSKAEELPQRACIRKQFY